MDKDGQLDKWTIGQIDKNGQMNKDEQMDNWTNGQLDK